MDASGRVLEQGSFADLEKLGGYVSSFALGGADWTRPSPDNAADPVTKDEELPKVVANHPTELDVRAEDDEGRATGDAAIYRYYIGAVGWIAAAIFVFAISMYAFSWTFPTVWVQWWSAANAVRPNADLGYWLGIYALLGVGAIVSLVVSAWQMIITMVPRSGERFHWSLLKTTLHAPMSFFASTDTGITLNRFSQDLQLVDMDLPLAALNTVGTLVLCAAQMALIGVESMYAAISFPVCIVAVYFIQRFYLRTSRQIRYLDLEAKSPLYSQFVECLNGLITIRAFGWQQALADRGRKLLDRSQRPFYLMYAIQRWLILVLELVVAGVAVLLIVLVVVLRGKMSAGAVGVALVNVILFSQNIQLLLQFWTTMETHIGAITRIKKFTEETKAEDLPREKEDPPATWPATGAVEFTRVSASYKSVTLLQLEEYSAHKIAGFPNSLLRMFRFPSRRARRSQFVAVLEGMYPPVRTPWSSRTNASAVVQWQEFLGLLSLSHDRADRRVHRDRWGRHINDSPSAGAIETGGGTSGLVCSRRERPFQRRSGWGCNGRADYRLFEECSVVGHHSSQRWLRRCDR